MVLQTIAKNVSRNGPEVCRRQGYIFSPLKLFLWEVIQLIVWNSPLCDQTIPLHEVLGNGRCAGNMRRLQVILPESWNALRIPNMSQYFVRQYANAGRHG